MKTFNGIVLTLNSLGALVDESPIMHSVLAGTEPINPDIVVTKVDGTVYILQKDDAISARRIFVAVQDNDRIWPKEANQVERQILERMLLVSQLAERTPLRLPQYWAQFKHHNLAGFFACGRDLAPIPLRWIVELQQAPPRDVCFWLFTTSARRVRLEDFSPPEVYYEEARSNWTAAYDQASKIFAKRAPSVTLQTTDVYLQPEKFIDVTQNLSRDQWLSKLTSQQLAFVNQTIDHSVKLRGPAGSGKTLTLELKALHEIAQARERGEKLRVLFATHSWVLAEEVDSDISTLSEWGQLDELTILPLLAVAQEILPTERQDSGRELVGEDSLSSKAIELNRINGILDEFVRGDWLTFRGDVSDELRARIESPESSDRAALAWDCMIEFGCVLGADGIFPGVGAEARYLRLPRTSWMMPLTTDADKRLLLHLYNSYMLELDEAGELTSDQLVNDFLNYLETFAWNGRRVKDGYDYIFVDEFHLFNVQERHLLRYLARSRFEYPNILMALDPKQSPWGIYTGLADASPSSVPGKIEEDFGRVDFGQVSAVDLASVHRFSPEILSLVKHLDWQFPNLDLGSNVDLGPDFGVGLSDAESSAESGPLPILIQCASQQAELIALYNTIRTAKESGGIHGQIAVAILEQQQFGVYQTIAEGLAKATGLKISIITSRDDIEVVQYRRRGIIMGPAEYLAGLQFDAVFIAGLPDSGTGFANIGFRRMRFLSLLYLAITRARREVFIFTNGDYGGVPEVLKVAADRGRIKLRRMEA